MPAEIRRSRAERDVPVLRRIAQLAERQQGRVSHGQLLGAGLSRAAISRWCSAGRLYREARGVYALGHRWGGADAALARNLLQGGPGSALGRMTAAWWRDLLRFPTQPVHIFSPQRTFRSPQLLVQRRKCIERVWHRCLPVTTTAQTLLDIAPIASEAALRRAIAQADHLGLVAIEALRVETSGRPNCRRLHQALERHLPQLAQTESPLEDRFVLFCEAHGLPIPEPNVKVAGHRVDALFREQRLVVELDGREVHGTPAAVVRDRGRELDLRAAGHQTIRYSSEQLDQGNPTASDLRNQLTMRRNPQKSR